MEIGTAIKKLRESKKINQLQLSIEIEISTTALCQIEKNKAFPRKETIDKICKALNVPPSYLLFFSITEEDVPEEKRSAFRAISPVMETILLQTINP